MQSNIHFNKVLIKYQNEKIKLLSQSNKLYMLSLNIETIPFSTEIENNIFDLININEKITEIEKYTNIINCEELEKN
jgi:hypothetical protein